VQIDLSLTFVDRFGIVRIFLGIGVPNGKKEKRMTSRFYSLMLSSVAALISVAAFAEKKPFGSARKYATGGEITRFCYTDKFGIGYTAFIHTFTNTDTVAEFKNKSGKALPVRILAVGGGGAGMDGMRVTTPGTARRPGGGGGGGGGVTEMNAVLPATDTWTIRVGKGGTIGTGFEAYKQPRGESGASCVSNENTDAEVILVPGGGAGGGVRGIYAVIYPTVGAAGGGGAGSTPDEALGSNGVYSSSIMGVIPDGAPFSGGNGGPSWATAYGGGGGGAGAPGEGENGGEGLASDITGVYVVYGSGGGGGGHSRLNYKEPGWERRHDGGVGGTNAGNGGNCEWDISEDGSITNIVVTKATPPLQNSGSGGGGGVSFGGGANFDDFGREYVPATSGADGVVIIRYDSVLSHPQGTVIVIR
jgi:hypothetical protein